MPFTPFHMGPGAAVKAITGKYFSLMVFGVAQVAIDIEPLIRILQQDSLLHGFTHTYIGAFFIGIGSMILGKPICEKLIKSWNSIVNFKYFQWLRVNEPITWFAACIFC